MANADAGLSTVRGRCRRLTTLPKPQRRRGPRRACSTCCAATWSARIPTSTPISPASCSRHQPSRWYLTGYLGPRRQASRRQRARTARSAPKTRTSRSCEALRSSEAMERGAPGPGNAADDGADRAAADAFLRAVLARPHRAAAARGDGRSRRASPGATT